MPGKPQQGIEKSQTDMFITAYMSYIELNIGTYQEKNIILCFFYNTVLLSRLYLYYNRARGKRIFYRNVISYHH